ncbi:MAG TPA: class I SAM-dependent methyltransferase [Acetobacteraceae bacterium]|nr:class I SAM-dependent methyltransferase [Acetobacteraceae bacterium]
MSGATIPAFAATDPDIYERFMGRWSTRIAEPFLTFAGVQSGQHVLDVGCGTGTISLALAQRGCTVVGIDASEPYLGGARIRRAHADISYEHGDARDLAYATASFDASVSMLAIDVIPEPERVVSEMRRVTRAGGVVACGTFDFWGGFSAEHMLTDTGAALDEGLRTVRDFLRSRPLVWPDGQAQLWRRAGLQDVVEVPLVVSFDYESFDDYWTSLATGPNRVAQRVQAMPAERREEVHRLVRLAYLAGLPDGPRSFATIVRAVRGLIP